MALLILLSLPQSRLSNDDEPSTARTSHYVPARTINAESPLFSKEGSC
jgi:hypothetical protein